MDWRFAFLNESMDMASNGNAWPMAGRFACGLLLSAGALIAATASAQENDGLVHLINAYRESPRSCEGRSVAPAAPLAPDEALSRVRIDSGGQLQDALKAAGYRAARAEAIMVSGPADANSAMMFIRQRYCRLLSNPQYTAISVSREGGTWRIVLARPLLSASLGDWRQAGMEVLRLVNAARAEPRTCGGKRFAAAPPVAWNAKLAAAALAHSRDMAARNDFRHEGKGGSGAGDRARQEGYRWRRIGENIATGQGSPQQVVSGWLASPGHCANIMDRGFTEMGAAYAINPDTGTEIFWTQVFGS
jgi:uncharacterized protein YkwD